MPKPILTVGIVVMAVIGASVGSAGAWWDDSRGYRGVRAYGCGPPCGGSYFSGVTVRVYDRRAHHRWPHVYGRGRQRY
jgi:hypothetical protein